MKKMLKFCHHFLWNFVNLVCQIFPDNPQGNKIRGYLFRHFFKKCGKNLQISKSTHILYPYNISLGDNVFIGFNAWLNGQGSLNIDDEVMLGPFVAISTGNHTKLDPSGHSFRFGQHDLKAVQINKGAWLGSHVSLMPGATIGHGSIIAAGGVVVGKTDSDSLYAGVPALFKKKLGENEKV